MDLFFSGQEIEIVPTFRNKKVSDHHKFELEYIGSKSSLVGKTVSCFANSSMGQHLSEEVILGIYFNIHFYKVLPSSIQGFSQPAGGSTAGGSTAGLGRG